MRARAVRMVLEHRGSFETQSAAVAAIAPKIGCIPTTLKIWVSSWNGMAGLVMVTSTDRDRIKELKREVRQRSQANEILRADLAKASHRQQLDAALRPKTQKVWDDNWRLWCQDGLAAAASRRRGCCRPLGKCTHSPAVQRRHRCAPHDTHGPAGCRAGKD